MAAMTKHDYEALGAEHAREGDVAPTAPYPRHGTSWQAIAYWKGRDAEERKLEKKLTAVKPITLDQATSMRADFDVAYGENIPKIRTVDTETLARIAQNWPGAAKSHVLCLARDLNQEKRLERRKRLHAAVSRMLVRHAGRDLLLADRAMALPYGSC